MGGLRNRLRKLESRLDSSSHDVNFSVIYDAALGKLSHSERGLVDEIMAHHARWDSETHRFAWDRLQTALVAAADELGSQFVITGPDLLH